jgi:hypothetical protein
MRTLHFTEFRFLLRITSTSDVANGAHDRSLHFGGPEIYNDMGGVSLMPARGNITGMRAPTMERHSLTKRQLAARTQESSKGLASASSIIKPS